MWGKTAKSEIVDSGAAGTAPDVFGVKATRITPLMGAIIAVILGILFVQAFTVSWRAVALFPLAVAFVLGCAIFINRLRDFLLFSLIFVFPLQFGYHVIFDPAALLESSFRSGIVVDSSDVILAVLYVGWIANAWTKTEPGKPLLLGGSIGGLLIVWTGFLAVTSLFVAVRLNYAYYGIFEFFKGFLLFWYLVNNFQGEKDLRIIVYALFANTVLHALFICFQYATGLNYTLHGEISQHFVEIEGFRPVGFSGSWDEAAILLATVVSIMLSYMLTVANGLKRQMCLLMISIVVVGLLLTKMRSAWLAALVSAMLVIGISYLKERIPSGLVVKVSIVALIVVLVSSPFVVHRLLTGTRGEDRLPLMYTAINMFEDNLLTGVGVANYFIHSDKYLPRHLIGTWVSTVHNEYLLRLSENGIIGFVVYYLILLIAIKKLWAGTRSLNPWVYSVSLGLIAALIGSLPNRFFSVYQFASTYALYCVILALAYHLESMERSESGEMG